MRPRFRDAGFHVGALPSGPRSSLTDVAGVRVGHVGVSRGDDVRTGITLIEPPAPGGLPLFYEKLPAATACGNGHGKITGLAQVDELGSIEAPIALTNTLAVGPVL